MNYWIIDFDRAMSTSDPRMMKICGISITLFNKVISYEHQPFGRTLARSAILLHAKYLIVASRVYLLLDLRNLIASS